MKRIIALVFLTSVLLTCERAEENLPTLDYKSIYGTWEYYQYYDFDGGPFEWGEVQEDDRYKLTFYPSGDLAIETNWRYAHWLECELTFNLFEGDSLVIIGDCPINSFVSTSIISYEQNDMVRTPSPSNCDEGCYFRFRKLIDIEVVVN